MILALQMDIDAILKAHGMKGVLIVLGVGALIAIGRGVRAAMQMIKARIEASDKALADVVTDARAERDAARSQREREANAFLQSLKDQSIEMRTGFAEVLREIREGNGSHRPNGRRAK
jgi:hypothetical protein